jgi:hypothetical protein
VPMQTPNVSKRRTLGIGDAHRIPWEHARVRICRAEVRREKEGDMVDVIISARSILPDPKEGLTAMPVEATRVVRTTSIASHRLAPAGHNASTEQRTRGALARISLRIESTTPLVSHRIAFRHGTARSDRCITEQIFLHSKGDRAAAAAAAAAAATTAALLKRGTTASRPSTLFLYCVAEIDIIFCLLNVGPSNEHVPYPLQL